MKDKINTKQMLSIPDENIRFMKVLEFYGYSGYKLAKEIESISEAKITHIRNGRNKPSLDLINVLLEKFPNINKNWLLTGTGSMLSEPETQMEEKRNNEKEEKSFEDLPIGEQMAILYDENFELKRRSLKIEIYLKIILSEMGIIGSEGKEKEFDDKIENEVNKLINGK